MTTLSLLLKRHFLMICEFLKQSQINSTRSDIDPANILGILKKKTIFPKETRYFDSFTTVY